MIKSPKNIFHSKMEKIALKLLSLNKKKINTNYSLSKNLNDDILESDSQGLLNKETKKDVLTIDYLARKNKSKKNLVLKDNFINNYTNYFSINSTDKLVEKEKSKIPKETKIVPKIKGLEEIAQNYIDKLNKKEKEESTSSEIVENSSLSLDNDINYEIMNKIYLIYEELKKEFDNIHNINYNKKENINIGDEEILRKLYFKCIVLGRDYYKVFLFGKQIQKILKIFNHCSEIGEFLIYQIYLFLSLIYLNENNHMENSMEMSYRTIILYSSQNFRNFLNLLKDTQLCADPKIMKNIKMKNKIIISVLKLINPNIPTKEKIQEFFIDDKNNIDNFSLNYLEEILINKKENKKKLKNKSKNNSLGIINLIMLLKRNKELSEKLIEIQKRVLLISLNNFDKNQKNSKSVKFNRNPNNINNNNQPKETNFRSESFSSSNKNNNINNIDNKNSLEKSNNNSNIEINTNPINYSITNNKNILPMINDESQNYKYFIFFELDETLVHYWEENNDSYVKIRWGVEDCLSQISDFCEISLISTSSQEYNEKILEKFNQNGKYVSNIIYKEDDEDKLNLSLTNRDMNKCIFICHEEEFFNVPKKNILTLTEFQGDERDREILFLCKEIMKIKNKDIYDVSEIIPEMMYNIRI